MCYSVEKRISFNLKYNPLKKTDEFKLSILSDQFELGNPGVAADR